MRKLCRGLETWKSEFKFVFGRNRKKERFLEFLVSRKNCVNLVMCMHKTKCF